MTTTKDHHRSTLCRVYAILIDLAEKRQKRPRHISQVLAEMNPCDCPDMTIYQIEEATPTNENDRR